MVLFKFLLTIFIIFILYGCDFGTKTREQEFFALDIYGDESNLLHEDGTFNFKCDGRVLRKNETEVNKTVKLSKDDITIQFECGDGSDFSFYYLICSDKSETCKNMKCSNPTSASFCVMRPGKKAPTDCSRIINQDCYGTIDFGRSRSEWFEACHEERARKKYHDLCQAFENVGENITFMTKDSGKHCDYPKMLHLKANGALLNLGSIGDFGSSLSVTCDEKPCDIDDIVAEERYSMNYIENLIYDNELQIINLLPDNYSAVTKIIIRRQHLQIKTYVYNVRLDPSVEIKVDNNKIECKLLNPPLSEQRDMFSLKMTLLENGNEIKNTECIDDPSCTITADAQNNCTIMYTCISEMRVKMCSPFYEDTKTDSRKLTGGKGCEDIPSASNKGRDYSIYIIAFSVAIALVFL